MTTMQDRALAAAQALAQPIDLTDPDWQPVPGDRAAAKKAMSTRLPEPVAQWIAMEAANSGRTPSAVIADLVTEAITSRQVDAGRPRRTVVDVADVHRVLDALARDQAA